MSTKKENNHVSSDNFVVIQGWMCNELNLKGNDLLVYALIHGFSQDGKSKYYGGRKYIANTFNISLPTVDKALQNLLDEDLIVKEPCKTQAETDAYYINIGSKETLLGKNIRSKETLPNNIETSKKENIDNFTNVKLEQPSVTPECPKRRIKLVDTPKSIKETVRDTVSINKPAKKKNLYEKCMDKIDELIEDAELKTRLAEYLKVRLDRKDIPFGTGGFEGIIKKLLRMSDSADERLQIVQQSIDRQYPTFYPLKQYNNYNSKYRSGVDKFGECGQVHSRRTSEAERANVQF